MKVLCKIGRQFFMNMNEVSKMRSGGTNLFGEDVIDCTKGPKLVCNINKL